MKCLVITFLTALTLFSSPFDLAQAVTLPKPHEFTCATCHTSHKTLGSTGYDNICLNCHRGGDPRAGAKSFAPGDAADPFGLHTSAVSNRFQISHRWDGSDTNSRAGAAPPVQPQMTSVRGRTSGSLACVRCHNQHSQENKPFLRMANDSDQMCMDCHRSRNTVDHTKGTHPVGVDYQQKASATPAVFNASPVNANPSNPTSAMKLLGGKVSCSTCHGVHATDSSSSTFDSFSTLVDLKPSSGNLLRTDLRAATADGINICTNCHAGKVAHNGRGQNIQCTDCHGGHVDTGDGSIPNVWLVRRDMGAGRGQVHFTATTIKNYMSAENSGVCQSCHAVPTGSGYQFHLTQTNATCNDCHAHGNSKGSFSVDSSKACAACHGYPPLANSAGAGGYAAGYKNAPSFTDEGNSGHAPHASSPYQKACVSCHNGNSHQSGTYQDVFIDTAGTVTATGGLTPVYDKTAQTCSNVYCHSNANPRGGTGIITKTTPSWNGGKGKIIGTAGECASCHSAASDVSPTWSAAHTKHIKGYASNSNFTCNTCHARTASGNSAIFGSMTARSMHTNGVKDVAFNSFAGGGTWNQATGVCLNTYCHNPAGAGGTLTDAGTNTSPSWTDTTYTVAGGKSQVNCGRCHKVPGDAGFSKQAAHGRMITDASSNQCNGCHGHSGDAAGVPGQRHIDGIRYAQGGSCKGCHGYEAGSWAAAPSINPGEGKGAHEKHIAHLTTTPFTVTLNPAADRYASAAITWTNICGVCHGSNPGNHMNGTVNVTVDAAFQFYSSRPPAYNGVPGVSSATTAKTCSNISCHYFTTPPWSTN